MRITHPQRWRNASLWFTRCRCAFLMCWCTVELPMNLSGLAIETAHLQAETAVQLQFYISPLKLSKHGPLLSTQPLASRATPFYDVCVLSTTTATSRPHHPLAGTVLYNNIPESAASLRCGPCCAICYSAGECPLSDYTIPVPAHRSKALLCSSQMPPVPGGCKLSTLAFDQSQYPSHGVHLGAGMKQGLLFAPAACEACSCDTMQHISFAGYPSYEPSTVVALH